MSHFCHDQIVQPIIRHKKSRKRKKPKLYYRGYDPTIYVFEGDPRLSPPPDWFGVNYHPSQPISNSWLEWSGADVAMFDISKNREIPISLDSSLAKESKKRRKKKKNSSPSNNTNMDLVEEEENIVSVAPLISHAAKNAVQKNKVMTLHPFQPTRNEWVDWNNGMEVDEVAGNSNNNNNNNSTIQRQKMYNMFQQMNTSKNNNNKNIGFDTMKTKGNSNNNNNNNIHKVVPQVIIQEESLSKNGPPVENNINGQQHQQQGSSGITVNTLQKPGEASMSRRPRVNIKSIIEQQQIERARVEREKEERLKKKERKNMQNSPPSFKSALEEKITKPNGLPSVAKMLQVLLQNKKEQNLEENARTKNLSKLYRLRRIMYVETLEGQVGHLEELIGVLKKQLYPSDPNTPPLTTLNEKMLLHFALSGDSTLFAPKSHEHCEHEKNKANEPVHGNTKRKQLENNGLKRDDSFDTDTAEKSLRIELENKMHAQRMKIFLNAAKELRIAACNSIFDHIKTRILELERSATAELLLESSKLNQHLGLTDEQSKMISMVLRNTRQQRIIEKIKLHALVRIVSLTRNSLFVPQVVDTNESIRKILSEKQLEKLLHLVAPREMFVDATDPVDQLLEQIKSIVLL